MGLSDCNALPFTRTRVQRVYILKHRWTLDDYSIYIHLENMYVEIIPYIDENRN